MPFPQTKSFPFIESFTNFTQSRFYVQKLLLHKRFFAVRKNFSFSQVKSFLPTQTFLVPTQSNPFPPSTFHSYTLNLLFAKNTAVLLIFALTPCAVKPERRTDSNHCRRYPENYCFLRCRLPDESRSLSQKHRIDRRFESSPESRGSQTSGVLFGSFCTTQKARKTFPSQEVSSFFKPRISAPQPQLRTATIKTFLRELRGFSNLEAAHKNNNFAQTNLNPSAAPSGYSFCFAENLALLFEAKSRAKPCQWSKSYNNWKKCRIDFSVEKIYNNKGIIPQFFQHFHKTASQFAVSIHGSKEENS